MKTYSKIFTLFLVLPLLFLGGCSTEEIATDAVSSATDSASTVSGDVLGSISDTINQNHMLNATVFTDVGNFDIEFTADATPLTVKNFVTLAKKGFYNNTIFHRTIKGFMIQGGDPTGTGSGGPGYTFADEFFNGEYKRGVIAMANRGPNTNGSQFFIMHKDYPLQKNYVIFGKVTQGIGTIDKIAEAQVVKSDSGELSKPVNPVKISKIEIFGD